jgi:hypothetical protein
MAHDSRESSRVLVEGDRVSVAFRCDFLAIDRVSKKLFPFLSILVSANVSEPAILPPGVFYCYLLH